ncbi:UNVERIFIED_CONTAM: hypothetical protein RMT77_010462 [Armadillidium vulgare]
MAFTTIIKQLFIVFGIHCMAFTSYGCLILAEPSGLDCIFPNWVTISYNSNPKNFTPLTSKVLYAYSCSRTNPYMPNTTVDKISNMIPFLLHPFNYLIRF